MRETAFTIHDDPETTRRIRKDLDTVTAAVQQADPGLRSLVLTGAFARGEGAMLDGRPQNDYDFVALRSLHRPKRDYDEVAAQLEDQLGLHIDLAPVAAWRLAWVRPTIFWYETALRGRVLHGEHLLSRIPVRRADAIERSEGLRLLVNRAAGLLIATNGADTYQRRLQAAKALLASLDAHLLADGRFQPSQRERQHAYRRLVAHKQAPHGLAEVHDWLEWAYRFKVDPARADPEDPQLAWRVAARTLLGAVPTALRHAGLPDLDAYARRDGLVDHVVYARRARDIPHAPRLLVNPTGRLRLATLRLLEASLDGHVAREDAQRCLSTFKVQDGQPLRALEALRQATLQ
jgi:hypothetical protein